MFQATQNANRRVPLRASEKWVYGMTSVPSSRTASALSEGLSRGVATATARKPGSYPVTASSDSSGAWRVIFSSSKTARGKQASARSSGSTSLSPPKCSPASTSLGLPPRVLNSHAAPESPGALISPSSAGLLGSGPISKHSISRVPTGGP